MYKIKNGRTLSRSHDVEKYHKELRKNLESEEGKQIMTQRSIQAEGVFANIKQDYEYIRLRRKGETDVKEEIYLVAIGYNIRKYYNHKLFVTALFLTELRYFKNPVRKTRKKYAIILKTI